ncbi:MAG: discoidin domain-containing protein, partial [Planctomycetota bacterium]
ESSSVEGGEGAHLATDGNHGSRWRCARNDTNPWLRITLERPARADGLLLSHGLARLVNAAAPRASRVAVVVNKTQTFAVDMPDDVHAKARLAFGELLNVREIEVRIVASEGRGQGEPVGFSELELVKGL